MAYPFKPFRGEKRRLKKNKPAGRKMPPDIRIRKQTPSDSNSYDGGKNGLHPRAQPKGILHLTKNRLGVRCSHDHRD